MRPEHDDIHQDHVGLFLAGQGDAVAAVLGLEYLVTMLFQHGGQLVHLGRRVINNQNYEPLGSPSRNKHQRPCGRISETASTGVAGYVCLDRAQQLFLAERRVRYWSEPTMRPLAFAEQAVLGGQHDHRGGLERAVVS